MDLLFPTEGYTRQNQVELVRGGLDYFAILLRLIRSAKVSIHLQVYIFSEDETGLEIFTALMDASRRGVTVLLLVDGYASQQISGKKIKELKAAGIRFRWFEPLLRSRHFYFGRRLHHKVVVVDASEALVGGLNIANRYNDRPLHQAWLDWAVFTRGEAAEHLFLLCQDLWNKSGWGKKRWKRVVLKPVHNFPDGNCLVRIRREDWVRRKSEISDSYFELLKNSRKEVLIMSSYFLPGNQLRKAIDAAVKRGVVVSVITASKSDVALAKQAERYFYRWMLDKEIQIFEYQDNILHGKISCADKQLTTVGSYNLNFLSAFASIELNLDILDRKFGQEVHDQLNKIILENCLPINASEWLKHYNLMQRVWQRICYDLLRMAFYLFTFYFKQKK